MSKEKVPEPFGSRLRELREAAGLSRREIIDAVNAGEAKPLISDTGFRDLEQGRYAPNWKLAEKLAAVLGVNIQEFATPPSDGAPSTTRPGRPRKVFPEEVIKIPVLGFVAAGPGSMEDIEGDWLIVPAKYSDCVAYRVRGRSMALALIGDGDIVIVRSNPEPRNGEKVVAWLVEDGGVVKILDARRKLLKSAGEEGDPIKLQPGDRILGALRAVWRECDGIIRAV